MSQRTVLLSFVLQEVKQGWVRVELLGFLTLILGVPLLCGNFQCYTFIIVKGLRKVMRDLCDLLP